MNDLWHNERFLERLRGRNAAKVRAYSLALHEAQGDFPQRLATPAGRARLTFKAGDKAVTADQGVIAPGLTVTIEKAEKVNGFSRYYVLGQWLHQDDLEAIPEEEKTNNGE